jgi:hypothetical protein
LIPAGWLASDGGLLSPEQPSKAARPLSAISRQLRAHVGRRLGTSDFLKTDVAFPAPTDLEGQLAAVVGSDAHIRFSL